MSEYDELAARLTQHILRARSDDADNTTNSIYASDISKCIRQTYYKMTETPHDEGRNDIDHVVNFVTAYGNMFQSVIQEQLALAGLYKGASARVGTAETNVSGRTDTLIRFEGKRIITESKGTHRKHFQTILDMLKQGKDVSEVVATYYDQLQLYLWLHPKEDLGMLIIGNRDMRYNDNLPPIILLPVERNIEWKKVNFARLDELNKSLHEHKPPRREYKITDWQCAKACPFKNRCWSGNGASESDSAVAGVSG
jgi:hypothetical protein